MSWFLQWLCGLRMTIEKSVSFVTHHYTAIKDTQWALCPLPVQFFLSRDEEGYPEEENFEEVYCTRLKKCVLKTTGLSHFRCSTILFFFDSWTVNEGVQVLFF